MPAHVVNCNCAAAANEFHINHLTIYIFLSIISQLTQNSFPFHKYTFNQIAYTSTHVCSFVNLLTFSAN